MGNILGSIGKRLSDARELSSIVNGPLVEFNPAAKLRLYIKINGEIRRYTLREIRFLQEYLRTGLVVKSALSIGINKFTASKFLKRKETQEFIVNQISKAAEVAEVDEGYLIRGLKEVWEGKREVTPQQIEAARSMARIIGAFNARNEEKVNNEFNIRFVQRGEGNRAPLEIASEPATD
mgnify:CR=1 FL=1